LAISKDGRVNYQGGIRRKSMLYASTIFTPKLMKQIQMNIQFEKCPLNQKLISTGDKTVDDMFYECYTSTGKVVLYPICLETPPLVGNLSCI